MIIFCASLVTCLLLVVAAVVFVCSAHLSTSMVPINDSVSKVHRCSQFNNTPPPPHCSFTSRATLHVLLSLFDPPGTRPVSLRLATAITASPWLRYVHKSACRYKLCLLTYRCLSTHFVGRRLFINDDRSMSYNCHVLLLSGSRFPN